MLAAKERPYKGEKKEDRLERGEETELLVVAETGSDPGYGSEEEGDAVATARWFRPRFPLHRRCSPLSLLYSLRSFITSSPHILLHTLSLPFSFYRSIASAPPVLRWTTPCTQSICSLRDLFIADLASWIAIMAHGMFYTGILYCLQRQHDPWMFVMATSPQTLWPRRCMEDSRMLLLDQSTISFLTRG